MEFKRRPFRLLPFSIILLSVFAFNSCIEDLTGNDDQKNETIPTFNFATSAKKTLNVVLKDMKNASVSGVVVEVFYQYPYDKNGQRLASINPVTKILTSAQGTNTAIEIPTYLSQIFLVTKFPGYANPDTIFTSSENLNVTIYPAGVETFNTVSALNSRNLRNNSMANSAESATPSAISNLWNTWQLSSFNKKGVPDDLVTSDDISNSLKSKINASLPESKPVPAKNPQFLTDASKANIKLKENCELWVTFVTEGAGYTNSLGYFYYPTNTPPTSVSEIKKQIIAFPNASFSNSGGGLKEGNKVKLLYYDEGTNTWTNVFPAGITVGWFLISNGFQNTRITNGNYWLYSITDFNDSSLKPQQNLILYDKTEEKMVIGFEDIKRTPYYRSDQDFNDVVFYATANPITAVVTEDLNEIKVPDDADNDNVTDTEDDYPTDKDKAFNNYFPGEDVWGTLAFEDLWPAKGDYDFNDLVADYNFMTVTNSKNEVVDIIANFKIRAMGATKHNGFAFQLNTPATNVSSVTGSINRSNRLTLNSNGTEANQTNAVIPVIDDVYDLFGTGMVNTVSGSTKAEEKSVSITIHLATPVATSALGTAPFNPFLIVNVNKERGREVHLPYKAPTELANSAFFGQNEDRTDIASGRYYVANQDFPWALNFPVKFEYPIETVQINTAYLKFNEWVESAGVSYPDWYLDNTNYRNVRYIYR